MTQPTARAYGDGVVVRGRGGLIGAVALAAPALAAAGVTWWLLAASSSSSDIGYAVIADGLGLFAVAVGIAVGLRRPANVVATLLGAFGAVPCLIAMSDIYDSVHSRLPGRFPQPSAYWIAFGQGLWMLWYLPAAGLLLVFPTGKVLSRRWRLVAVGLPALVVVFCVVAAFTTTRFDPPYEKVANPLPTPHGVLLVVLAVADGLCPLGLLGLLIACYWSVVRRYRTAGVAVRAQLKWLLLGAVTVPGCLLLCWTSYLLLGNPDLVAFGLSAILISIPSATVIGLLRYNLYDVDRALSAAVTYTAVTTGLLLLFTAASAIGGAALGHRSPLVAAVATAVCATALAPLRTRLRDRVDRRIYPSRRRVLDAVGDLQTRVHAGAAQPEELEAVLAQALDDAQLRVGYRVPGTDIDVDAAGQIVPDGVPVVVAGAPVGVLQTATTVSKALLREVSDAAGLLFEVARLRAGLSDALRDVETSRSRLLQAGDEERRRLERDLHDGAQQRLVAVGMNLRVAQRHLLDGTVDVSQILDDTVDELSRAVAELRQIAHGLRPSALDDGLGPALITLLARSPVPVALDIDPGGLPDEIATTAFYVASEAVTNAIKHADAEHIALAVRRVDHHVTVRVTDDGAGSDPVKPGVGLRGLTDRVAAAGGALRIDSQPGHGTVVEAVLPCAS